MRKTSVYLSDELKTAMSASAAQTGRSEAEFIRGAIELAIQHVRSGAAPVEPEPPRRVGPLLIGVGVGPGAADLVTPRARTAIATADLVVAASISADAIGRAEAVIRAAGDPLRIERLGIDVTGSDEARAASFDAARDALVDQLDSGKVVAFLTIGDPNMFSVFPRIASAVRGQRPEVPIEMIPGVTAFQELAAASGTVVGDDHQSIRIVNVSRDPADVADLVDDTLGRPSETLVLYRGGRAVPTIGARVVDAGRGETAVIGEQLGLPDQRCVPLAAGTDHPASYLACMIAPAERLRTGATEESEESQ